jgi:HK97 family phage major capsid protein
MVVAWMPPPFLLSSEPRRFTLSKPILQGVFVEYIKQQHEARQKAWHEAKALLDVAAAEKRDLTAEENAKYENISADLDSRAKVIETLKADAEREIRAAESMQGFENQARPIAEVRNEKNDADAIRALARGDIRSYNFEKRDVTKGSTGSPVPTSFYDQVILLARTVGPMLETSTILNTAGGENLQIPSLSAYSTGTVTSEGNEIGESDPTFNNFVTLGAFKYSFLTQVSRELVEDAGVDILGFLATQTGNAMGYAVNNALTVGTGTTQPNGLVSRAGSAVTGTSLNPTADNLIDLVYSIETVGRRLPGTGFQMNSASIANVRKLKDGSGQYLFTPSLSADARDLLLGYPIFENPAMASAASAAKPVIFGNLPSYYVRQVGGLKLDRSDDFAFSNDLITFRSTFRVDGNLIQTSHVKFFKSSNS